MEENNKVEKFLRDIKEYAEVRFGLVSLNIQDKFSDIVSSLVAIVILSVLALLILLFAGVGGAILLGEYFNNPALGFFCIAGFYILLAFILFLEREKWIKFPIRNYLIKKIHLNDEN
ncbi:MAG: phage holin family protein [Bacteroidetes bacterium]|nr:phage holin family protein [Bacteroidota bacterium]